MSTHLNGSHNRPSYNPHVEVQFGWVEDTTKGHLSRTPKMIIIPFTMNPDCQYTKTALGQADAGCHGCKRREDKKQ